MKPACAGFFLSQEAYNTIIINNYFTGKKK